MIWEILLALLASAGVLFLVGCIMDWCLPRGGREVTLLYAAGGPAALEHRVRRHRWRGGGELVIVDQGLDAEGQEAARLLCRDGNIRYCKAGELPAF